MTSPLGNFNHDPETLDEPRGCNNGANFDYIEDDADDRDYVPKNAKEAVNSDEDISLDDKSKKAVNKTFEHPCFVLLMFISIMFWNV